MTWIWWAFSGFKYFLAKVNFLRTHLILLIKRIQSLRAKEKQHVVKRTFKLKEKCHVHSIVSYPFCNRCLYCWYNFFFAYFNILPSKQNSAVVVVIIIVWNVLCISCALFRLQHNCIKSNVQKFDLDHNVIIKDTKSYF